MRDYIAAKHVLHTIANYEPEALILEIEEIIYSINNNRTCDTFPELGPRQLEALLEDFLTEAEEMLLLERAEKIIRDRKKVKKYIRNILTPGR